MPADAHTSTAADDNLPAWLDAADARHAEAPAALAAELLARAPHLPADAHGARALRLAEHVLLAHLGDAAALATLRNALPPALAQAGPTATAVQRLRWAWAMLQQPSAPTPALPDVQRWRALQNVVLAMAWQGRPDTAAALLAADEAAARAQGSSEAGQAYAATANNVATDLQQRQAGAGTARDAAQDALMLQAAAIARRAWGHAGTWLHAERAEYRLAHCHAAAGNGAAAVRHAGLCLAGCQAAGEAADAVEHFFAHEALAVAHRAAGNAPAAAAARAEMASLLPHISDSGGLRAWCAESLADLPAE